MNTDRFRFMAWYEYMGSWWMEEVDTFSLIDNEIEVLFKSGSQGVSGDLNKHIYIMQCTGLKDSEGNLIWEGDIVEFIDNDGWETRGAVVWDEQGFWAMNYTPFELWDIVKSMKVIGNIYENPELLREPK